MGLSDLWNKKKTTETVSEAEAPKKEILVKHGTTGTEISSGMLQEEYNPDLAFPESVRKYDEMRKSDATIAAVLKALKNPLLSAEWDIQSGGESDKDKEIKAFVNKNLFENINFQDWLRQTLSYLDFWFMYFEKIYQIKNGMIEWCELAPRLQKAHYQWGINGKDWIDGHPAGVTQQLISSDDEIDKDSIVGNSNFPTIPWSKIILFTNDREGNNYEGISILRPAYKHYFYKDLGYRIQSVSSERYGVGTPVATVKNSMGKPNRSKVEEFLKNIRSNEKSYALLTEEVTKFEIMTPSGTGVGAQIEKMIEHHDKKLYDMILAGFLNLTSWDGGSNALSKDQSSFFLRWLQSVADYIVSVMNVQIKELVDMNYTGVEVYPTLFVSEIGQTSMDESISSITSAVGGGLVKLNPDDETAIRAILKLPPLPPADEDDLEIAQIEADMDIEWLQIGTLDDFSGDTEDEEPVDDEEIDGPDVTKKPEVQKQLAEITDECIMLGKPLTDEHKKKISEALKKALDGWDDSTTVRDKMGTLTDMQDRDPVMQRYQSQKERLTSMFDNLKTAMASIKEKKSSMSKAQKKTFAKEFKAKLDELTESRKSLQRVAAELKKKTAERKSYIRETRKEATRQLKAVAEQKKAEKKAEKEREKMLKKNKNLSEDDQRKYSGCVMLNVNRDSIKALDIPEEDLVWDATNYPPHVTLLYGINTGIPLEKITKKIDYNDQEVEIEGMTVFDKDDADVIVLLVKKDEWLTDINTKLRELDYQNEFPEYKPHITLAYVKSGEGKKYLNDSYNGKKIATTGMVYTSSDSDENGVDVEYSEPISVPPKPTPREVAFTDNISKFESFLEKKYSEAETIVTAAEKEYQDVLVKLYEESESDMIDGVVCLKYDKTKITAGKNKVAAITARLEKKLIGSDLEDEIFKEAIVSAKSTLEENEMKLSWSLDIPKGQIATFIEWYKSNMQGVIFNESRRVLENITLNYGSEASVELAKQTAKEISFNKNILALSFITHPRALYKFVIYDEAQAAGFTLFKTIVPASRMADLMARPNGITAGIAYTVLTAAQINAYAAKTTGGKTAEALTGLGLHHGSFEYYYPIASVDIDIEKQIAKIQRDEIFPNE